MLLNRLIHRSILLAQPRFVITRMTSTVAGESGRKYTRGAVLQSHQSDPSLSVFMAK
jgi:hypothetical protein